MQATQVLLVRHGTTDVNLTNPRILQGCTIDLPLNDIGHRQAEKLATFLTQFNVKCVYSSPLRRACETAGAIAEKHYLEVRQIHALRECDVGAWEGKDWSAIAAAYPEQYRLFQNDPTTYPHAGGESYTDVLDRVLPAFARLLTQHVGETVVLVAHNIVNRVLLAHLMGLALRKAKSLRQSRCCVNVIRQEAAMPARVITLNAISHLTDNPDA